MNEWQKAVGGIIRNGHKHTCITTETDGVGLWLVGTTMVLLSEHEAVILAACLREAARRVRRAKRLQQRGRSG